ncbi:tetratricopeptide repeat protein [Seonamhaeicola aphaedonensis]|uniref:Tetratricopeptide repeat protein n=1 Tax=Seonamhaeicola aphaedonensis TaxID=1461338 RepID=A0A3D9H9A5_9FLAO|nr:hypothetical protein [Seonamhaeicola aphaedonensis]RED46082.1 hypothetical protein DFQ02_107232 [Seonamhaeicola aphaedonensis]
MSLHTRFKLFIIIIFLLVSTISFPQDNYSTQNANNSSIPLLEIEDTEANDEKVLDLGYKIRDAILEEDVEKFMLHIDYDSFGKLVTKDIDEDGDTKAFKNGFLKGLKSGIKSLPQKIIKEVNAGGYYDFVNFYYSESNKTYFMLFRFYSPITGINYHDYEVSISNNTFTFKDIYIYLSGEDLSQTFRRFYMYNLPKKSLLNFFGEDNAKEFDKVVNAVYLYNRGDFLEAYNKFKEIKGHLSTDKFILIIKAACASNINDEEYKIAMETIAKKYPDDSSIYLTQLDYHLLNANYETALKLVDRLQVDTSDDFLNLLKGNIEYNKLNYDKALEHFKYISDNYPDFFEGHSSYLTMLALKEEFENCITFLTFLVDEGYNKTDLIEFIEEPDENGENNLNNLAESELYKKWKNT